MSSSSSNEKYNSNYSEDDDDELNQQLQTLKSLVPNITQTDQRSILEQTRDYLKRIHEETERIENEIKNFAAIDSSSSSSSRNQRNNTSSSSKNLHILKVEIEKVGDEGEFVVKILWERLGSGAAAEFHRAIHYCDLEINIMNSIMVSNFGNPHIILTTALLKVKRKRKMTEQELHDVLMRRFQS